MDKPSSYRWINLGTCELVIGDLVDQINIYLGVWFLTLKALLNLVFLIRFVKEPQQIK